MSVRIATRPHRKSKARLGAAQHKALAFIVGHCEEHGSFPSRAEIARQLGWAPGAGGGGVATLLDALQSRGIIEADETLDGRIAWKLTAKAVPALQEAAAASHAAG